jgi:D-alanine--poly(phosphoribitol) ligase subunit 2
MSVSPAFERPGEDDAVASLLPQLGALFRDVLNRDVPSPDTDLIETGMIDSLALVELLFEIEQRFGVDLALEELDVEDFRTLERLASVLARHAGPAGSPA